MKTLLTRLGVLVLTFAIGVGCAALFYFGLDHLEVDQEIKPMEPVVDCQTSITFPGNSIPVSHLHVSKKGLFPVEIVGYNDRYAKHLRAMGEIYLPQQADGKDELYRFLWLRTFHHAIEVSIERTGAKYTLWSQELGGAAGYEPGQVVASLMRPLSPKEWCAFRRAIDTADFWNMPTEDNPLIGLDGSQWVIEGVREGRYHIVDRWTPTHGGYYELGKYLLALSGRSKESLGESFY